MALRLGDIAPDFTADTTQGSVSFHDWKGDSWSILFSHPKDFTPVCTTELGTVAKLKPEWDKRNVKPIGLSVDPVDSHISWEGDIEETQGQAVNFPMIADPERTVADLYDMIHPNASDTMTVRSVFVIDPANKVRLILTYPASTEPALKSVSLTVAPGKTLAVVGKSGSGKSTLASLIPRFFDVEDGVIEIDGRPINNYTLKSLRNQIALVNQHVILFEGTIAENIAVGRSHIGEADVWEALRLVGLESAVQAMRDGLQTRITNGGRSLPSHVATKLLFAQGIAGNPRLVLFDDLFMNLLADDRRRLLQILADPTRAWTVIAVSHDPVLLESFGRVLVVRDGTVAADGTFAEVRDDPYCEQLLDSHERSAAIARNVRAREIGGAS
jgi:alkyl hydroperoxide reductase subunit AhpC/ABC-type branched-subunit amino acid transport system ATPase component